jgi:hypothetical protein
MAREGQTMIAWYIETDLRRQWTERAALVGRNESAMLERAMKWYLSLPPDYPPDDVLPPAEDPPPPPPEKASPYTKRGPKPKGKK